MIPLSQTTAQTPIPPPERPSACTAVSAMVPAISTATPIAMKKTARPNCRCAYSLAIEPHSSSRVLRDHPAHGAVHQLGPEFERGKRHALVRTVHALLVTGVERKGQHPIARDALSPQVRAVCRARAQIGNDGKIRHQRTRALLQ